MSNHGLPQILKENGVRFFVCPCCNARGAILVTRTGGGWSEESMRSCDHCFGFGRLPVPSWYREQIREAGHG